MALSPLSGLSSLSPYQTINQPFKTSTTQFQASFEKALIDITTSDGDTVTLQRQTSHAALSQSMAWQDSFTQGAAFTAQSLDTHSFSYTVQGDLSAEELQDLGELFDSLSVIAEDFYQGHLEEAMAGALSIGELGSLSSLSATFTMGEISASQMTSHHPYAQADSGPDINDEKSIGRHRQAQWQQILAYLEKREQNMSPLAKKESDASKEQGQDIMAKIKKTLEHHQRLAPFIDKLIEKALTDRQHHPENHRAPHKNQGVPVPMDQDFDKMAGGSVRV